MTRAAIIERIWKKVDGRMAAAIRLEIQVSAIKVILKEFEGYIYIIYIYIVFFFLYLDPPSGCQTSAQKRSGLWCFFWGPDFRPGWRIQVYTYFQINPKNAAWLGRDSKHEIHSIASKCLHSVSDVVNTHQSRVEGQILFFSAKQTPISTQLENVANFPLL